MELIDVVRKLTGPIEPAGDSNIDRSRLENLKELTDLVQHLIVDIDRIATENMDRQEASMKTMGEHCWNFLDKLGIEE